MNIHELKIGTCLCAITSEGRYATLRLEKWAGTNRPVTFDVTVSDEIAATS